MSDDLITSLRALAAARHDDLSIAVDAVIEIERQRAEIERLRKAHQAACEGGDLLRAEIERLRATNKQLVEGIDTITRRKQEEIERLRAENERLREVLKIIRINGPDSNGSVWWSFYREGGVRVIFVVGHEEETVSQALLEFEHIRRNALEGKP